MRNLRFRFSQDTYSLGGHEINFEWNFIKKKKKKRRSQ